MFLWPTYPIYLQVRSVTTLASILQLLENGIPVAKQTEHATNKKYKTIPLACSRCF